MSEGARRRGGWSGETHLVALTSLQNVQRATVSPAVSRSRTRVSALVLRGVQLSCVRTGSLRCSTPVARSRAQPALRCATRSLRPGRQKPE